MADVFLSYAREDRRRAEQLAMTLTAMGWTVWWDTTLVAGDAFQRVIAEQLRNARCIVVLWSKAALESDWVPDEAAIGKRRGVLVPCFIEEVDPPLGFGQYHTPDLTSWDGDPDDNQFRSFLGAVERHAPRSAETIAAAVPLVSRRWWKSTRRFFIGATALAVLGVMSLVAIFTALRRMEAAGPNDLLRSIERGLDPDEVSSVIGFDDRMAVRNTTVYPWSGICALRVRTVDGRAYVATGVLIGQNAVLTADYVVFFGGRQQVLSVEIIPALNGKVKPLGSMTGNRFYWVGPDEEHAEGLAVITFENEGRQALRTLPVATASLTAGSEIELAGYPGDRDSGTVLYRASGRVVAAAESSYLHDADTYGGMGGAPVWRVSDGRYQVIAIHTRTQRDGKHALRITEEMLTQLQNWIRPAP